MELVWGWDAGDSWQTILPRVVVPLLGTSDVQLKIDFGLVNVLANRMFVLSAGSVASANPNTLAVHATLSLVVDLARQTLLNSLGLGDFLRVEDLGGFLDSAVLVGLDHLRDAVISLGLVDLLDLTVATRIAILGVLGQLDVPALPHSRSDQRTAPRIAHALLGSIRNQGGHADALLDLPVLSRILMLLTGLGCDLLDTGLDDDDHGLGGFMNLHPTIIAPM